MTEYDVVKLLRQRASEDDTGDIMRVAATEIEALRKTVALLEEGTRLLGEEIKNGGSTARAWDDWEKRSGQHFRAMAERLLQPAPQFLGDSQ